MKKTFIFLFLIPCFAFTTSFNQTPIVGSWKVLNDDGTNIGFSFDAEGYLEMINGDEIAGGKEFDRNGKKASMEYVISLDKYPIEIDFLLSVPEDNIESRMLFIADFKHRDTLLMAGDSNQIRPTEFNDDNTLIFYRIKE